MIGKFNFMKTITVFVITLIVTLTPINASNDIIMEPITSSAEEIALILIQSDGLTPDRYEPLCTEIQEALPYSTWIGIPSFIFDSPNSLDFSLTISNFISSMEKKGMTTSTIFFGAHSSSGLILQDYLVSNWDKSSGQILLGSVLQRKYNGTEYPVPTLTIGGELDGVMRITRIAEAYYNQIEVKENITEASLYTPVVMIEGLSHMQFASGEPTSYIQEYDLIPEISDNQAYQLIASDISVFIQKCLTNDYTSNELLLSRVQQSYQFFQPIITALLYEGYVHFKKPCYCKYDTCDSKPDCYGGCPWSNTAMTIMGSGLDYVTINSRDSFHPAYEVQANLSDPAHHPKILNQCTINQQQCILNITSVTQGVYENDDKSDKGLVPISAKSLKVKMVSRQAVWTAGGQTDVPFNETDGGSNCAQINQASYDWAKQIAKDTTIQRFDSFGEEYIMGDDVVYNAGPGWIWNLLKFEEADDKSYVEVIAPTLKTDVNYIIKLLGGYDFCQLLSPARSIEWLYVDGLRSHYSLQSQSSK